MHCRLSIFLSVLLNYASASEEDSTVVDISEFEHDNQTSEKPILRYGFQRTHDCPHYKKVYACVMKCLDLNYNEAISDRRCKCSCYKKLHPGSVTPAHITNGTHWLLGPPSSTIFYRTVGYPSTFNDEPKPHGALVHQKHSEESKEKLKHNDKHTEEYNEKNTEKNNEKNTEKHEMSTKAAGGSVASVVYSNHTETTNAKTIVSEANGSGHITTTLHGITVSVVKESEHKTTTLHENMVSEAKTSENQTTIFSSELPVQGTINATETVSEPKESGNTTATLSSALTPKAE